MELWYGGQLVKHFRVPAENQMRIFAAFDEEHWPDQIDDPLPFRPGHDRKTRLHDVINRMNRNQEHPLLRFGGNGAGTGLRWYRRD